MQRNRWSRKFDWIKLSGGTYIQEDRLEKYNENRFISIGDVYFKFNKYLTGVTYTYINNLNDIYKRDLLTGDGLSIVNMYNEYDVIDRFLKNQIIVDVAADSHIDINTQWLSINGIKLKPGHLVLLKNQNVGYETQNDVYIVNNTLFLENANYLKNRDMSDKFSCCVKLGDNMDKQYFLVNNGDNFPITGEYKYFIEGKSMILKNLISYNLENTQTESSLTSKIIFTDYELARKQLRENSSYYYYFTVNGVPAVSLPTEFVTIKYHHDSYTIRLGSDKSTSFTGSTVDISNSIFSYSGKNYTSINYPSTFDCMIFDYLNISIYSGDTIYLSYNTHIKNMQHNYIILEDIIPNRILKELENLSFVVNNFNVSNSWYETLDKLSVTPYSEFFKIEITSIYNTIEFINIKIDTKEYVYDKYFDYDDLIFSFDNDTQVKKFEADNQYISYKLYDRLKCVDSVFDESFEFYNKYKLTGVSYQYTDNDRIKIFSNETILKSTFKPYTYVDVVGLISSGVSLVYSVDEHEIVIEKPSNWNFYEDVIVSIQNIDGLLNISNILYEVYINETFDWYVKKNDNERKYICKSYANIIMSNLFLRKKITGILYENDNNEFVLNLYDLGTNINTNISTSDKNLYFSTIELVYIGSDKKSRLPVPLNLLSGVSYDESYWQILNGGVDDILNGKDDELLGDVIYSGLNSILPGVNNIIPLYTIIDGGLDSSLSQY